MDKVGIVGTGKRFLNVYRDILESMGCDIFVWNRDKEKLSIFKNLDKYNIVDNLEDFKSLDLDIVLTFLPPDKSFDILGKVDFGTTLLIETPVLDPRWASNLSHNKNIGVLEQWIYLPTEQFKEIVYESGLISRPYWVFNDGRSYDYHAIAQLRKYCKGSAPVSFQGNLQDVNNKNGFIDKTGNMNKTSDFWTHGQSTLKTGELLMHSFSYNCKQSTLKPMQLLRSYSVDGSIVSGRMKNMDDDYENFVITYCDKDRNCIVEKVNRKTDANTITNSISTELSNIVWNNPYKSHMFNDQQVAIATLLEESSSGNFYHAQQGYYDFLTIEAMKQAYTKRSILMVTGD